MPGEMVQTGRWQGVYSFGKLTLLEQVVSFKPGTFEHQQGWISLLNDHSEIKLGDLSYAVPFWLMPAELRRGVYLSKQQGRMEISGAVGTRADPNAVWNPDNPGGHFLADLSLSPSVLIQSGVGVISEGLERTTVVHIGADFEDGEQAANLYIATTQHKNWGIRGSWSGKSGRIQPDASLTLSSAGFPRPAIGPKSLQYGTAGNLAVYWGYRHYGRYGYSFQHGEDVGQLQLSAQEGFSLMPDLGINTGFRGFVDGRGGGYESALGLQASGLLPWWLRGRIGRKTAVYYAMDSGLQWIPLSRLSFGTTLMYEYSGEPRDQTRLIADTHVAARTWLGSVRLRGEVGKTEDASSGQTDKKVRTELTVTIFPAQHHLISWNANLDLPVWQADFSWTAQLMYTFTLDRNSFSAGAFEMWNSGKVEGQVFEDMNADGIYDEGTDRPVFGAVVRLQSGETARTDETGRYYFEDVAAGLKMVEIDPLALDASSRLTTPMVREVVVDGVVGIADFGYTRRSTLFLRIVNDLDLDGVPEEDEPLMDGTVVRISDGGGYDQEVGTEGGMATIRALPPGKYTISVVLRSLPPDFSETQKHLDLQVLPSSVQDAAIVVQANRALSVEFVRAEPSVADPIRIWVGEKQYTLSKTQLFLRRMPSGDVHIKAAWRGKIVETDVYLGRGAGTVHVEISF